MITEMFYTKKRNRKGYAIQNLTEVCGRNANGSVIIGGGVYQVDDGTGRWYASGECRAIGTFDLRFMQGPYATREEALQVINEL